MATTLEELVVKIQADSSELQKGMQEAMRVSADSSAKIAASLDAMSQKGGKSVSSLQRIAETAFGFIGGQAIIGGIRATTGAVTDLFKSMVVDGVAGASASEAEVTRLNYALAQAGHYSRGASQSIQDFANELQNATKYENDAIVKTAATIESLGQLDEKGLKVATKAAVDLSAALSIDLNTATQLVGKAAAGEVGSFSRYGLIMENGATTAETFARAMEMINSRFGGAAANQVNTYAGATAQVTNNWGDMTKELGFAVTGNQAVIGSVKEVNAIVQEMTKWLNTNQVEVKKWIAEGLIVSAEAVKGLAGGIDRYLIPAGQTLTAVFKTAGSAIGAVGAAAVELVSGNFGGASEVMRAFGADTKEAFAEIGERTIVSDGLDAIAGAADRVGAAAKRGLGELGSRAIATVEPVNQGRGALDELTASMVAAGEAGQKLADDLLAFKPDEIYGEQTEYIKAQLELRQVSLEEAHALELEAFQAKVNAEQGLLDEAYSQKKISDEAYSNAYMALERKRASDKLTIEAKQKKAEDDLNKAKIDAVSQTFGNLSSLQKTKSRELFEIGKAAAVAQAMVDAGAAIVKTMSSVPYPFNIPLAAAQGIAGGVQVSNIVGTDMKLATGIDSVPGIGTQDQVRAMLAPNERVLTGEQNKDLTKFLSGDSIMVAILRSIDARLSQMSSGGGSITIQIGSRTLTEVLRDEIRGGRMVFA